MERLPLADILSVLLPSPDDTLLLRSLFAERDDAARCWAEWQSGKPDIRNLFGVDRPDLRRLLPIVDRCLTDHGIPVAEDMRQLLRAATLWETLRFRRIEEILELVLGRLAEAGIEPILVGGLAIALTSFRQPALRHCHDIDLLIEEDSMPTAICALTAAGFRREPGIETQLVHLDGLPIKLSSRLLSSPFYTLPEAAMRHRATIINAAGGSVRVLLPQDNLLHRLARVASGKPGTTTKWAIDSMTVMKSTPLSERQWQDVVDAGIAARLAVPFAVLLDFLQSKLSAEIPGGVGTQLTEASRKQTARDDEAAIFHLRETPFGGFSTLLASGAWRSRLTLLRSMFLPHPSVLKEWRGHDNPLPILLWYVIRPLRGLAIRAGLLRPSR